MARSRRPATQPRPGPDRRGGGPARPRSSGPDAPRIEPEDLRGEGGSGLCSRQGRRPGVLRLPGRPRAPIRDFCPLGVRHGPRHPAALAAARAADRHETFRPDAAAVGRRPAAEDLASPLGRTPPQARSRWPPPPPSTLPPISRAARKFSATLRPNSGRNRQPKLLTCSSTGIASRPPKRRAGCR
jgi:hypothetical protein